ncbi:aspartate 1-decarboxylase autocleavage activator PanM [Enterobacterales bacterium CwR94]|nr:aspartate 1-decarboxylase autocleavage activator PanM [Enterobacterales bacterium CwR94]
MKLTIERITQPTAQDQIDLQKIWPDIPLPALFSTLDENQRLYAARFNDRLLAAITLRIEGVSGYLQHLVVRDVTRRRGVGHYLLQEVLQDNTAISHWLMASDGVEDHRVIAAFMQHNGFRAQPEGWVWNR